jgi:hypothetical protein
MSEPTLAERHTALVNLCGDQRDDLYNQVHAITAPIAQRVSGIQHLLAGKGKLIAIASAAVGIVAMRRKRALPLVASALSLWKTAQPLLAMLRRR